MGSDFFCVPWVIHHWTWGHYHSISTVWLVYNGRYSSFHHARCANIMSHLNTNIPCLTPILSSNFFRVISSETSDVLHDLHEFVWKWGYHGIPQFPAKIRWKFMMISAKIPTLALRCRWHPDYLDPYLSSQVKIIGTWKAHKKKACKNGYGFWMFLVSSSWYPLVSFFFLAIGYASLKLPWYSNRSPCVFVSVFLRNHDQTSTTEQCDLNQYVALFLYSGWSADFQEWIVISNILDSVTPI
jgi:hypothetical protein